MTLSRLVLNPRSRLVARDLADCQQLHRTVLSAFPDAAGGSARQRFGVLFRIEYCRGAAPVLLIQSGENPDFSPLPSGYLAQPPITKDIAAAWRRIARDSVFRFRLRANPTRKIETKSGPGGARRNGRRVELKTEEEQLKWLARKSRESGFEILSVRAAAEYPDVWVSAEGKVSGSRCLPDGAGSRPRLTFASVLFNGKLRVTDMERFRAALERGIGSAKGYGFGLLSVAPVRDLVQAAPQSSWYRPAADDRVPTLNSDLDTSRRRI
jgi:CRISPR system Cascade subunit CasE